MNTLYKAYDDITASDAFKQRMVWTLQSEVAAEADDKKVVRFPVKKKTIAILIAAAALVVLIGCAVAAVAGVFTPHKDFTTPAQYLNVPKEEREQSGIAISDVEEAIENATPGLIDYSIRMLPEMKIISPGNVAKFVQKTMPEKYNELVRSGEKINHETYCRVLMEEGYVILWGMEKAEKVPPHLQEKGQQTNSEEELSRICDIKEEDVNAYRQKKGQPVYSEEDWGWIRDIKPEIEEVLVDGNQWSFNIRLNTDHGLAFTNYHTEPEDWDWPDCVYHGEEQRIQVACHDAFFTIQQTGQSVSLPGFSSGVVENSVSETGCTLGTTWEAYDLDQNAAYAEMNEYYANKTDGSFPTEGIIQFTMQIAIKDAKVREVEADGTGCDGGILGVIQLTFEFDASTIGKTIVTEHPLSGSIVLMMIPGDLTKFYNELVSLDGVVLEETLTYQSTGILIQYAIKSAPDGWTEDHTRSLIRALSVTCIPEREEDADKVLIPDTFLSGTGDMAFSGILPVFPSDYEAVREMRYKVRLSLESTVSVNGEPVGEDWVMRADPVGGWTKHMDGTYTYNYDRPLTDSDEIRVSRETIAEYELQLP